MKLLMVGHSYVVALNRRLCREVARAGGDSFAVTVAAPASYQGDLRPIALEQLDGEPYHLEAIPTRFSKVPHVFLYGKRLRTLLAEPWDLVHAWEEPYIFAGWQIARATQRGTVLVYSSFQNQPKRYPPPFSWIERYCLSRASGWTAFGHTVAENLQARPLYRSKPSQTIPLGVDLDVFRPDPALRRETHVALGWSEPGPPIVGYLGRFVSEKGVGLLTRVLDRLPAGSWRALLVGGGALEGELQTWASAHPAQARVVTGVPHDSVPAYLNAMDLLAAPSQTTPQWREQFGRMLVEAMACGVPVVASDSGEIPHVVSDAGRIVPEGNEGAWVASLGNLLESPDVRSCFRERGLARAAEVYAWPKVAQQYVAFFKTLGGSSLSSRAPLGATCLGGPKAAR
jgi:glycosyltransferase involved in cell wall biosynthesis